MNFRKGVTLSVLSTMLLTTMFSTVSYAGEKGKDKHIDKKEKQAAIHSKISEYSKGKEKISWNEKKGVPNFVSGKLSKKNVKNSRSSLEVFGEVGDLFDMSSPVEELSLLEETRDEMDTNKFKYQQVYNGIPVFGQELILHTDQEGEASTISGYYDPEVKHQQIETNPQLSKNEAIKAAKEDLGLHSVVNFEIEKADLFIYPIEENNYRLAYLVTLSTLEGDSPTYMDVFVDARDSSILNKINKVELAASSGTGTGVLGDAKSPIHTDSYVSGYYLRDLSKPMFSTGGKIETYTANNGTSLPGTLLSDTDNVWTDRAAVDAHYYAGKVYDYYYNNLNRNSFDGNGATLKSTVHYQSNYNNAFWNGIQMVYGDGDGSTFVPLSGSLDVVAHEITHAVTERTANLVYQDQSGALNESFSDVFGNLIENKPDNDWLIGEDIYTPNTPNDALRSMSNPPAQGDPDHMDNYVNTTADNGGVHTNSGIPNKAFYNFVTAAGITRDNAGKVWYRALTQYLTTSSQFIDTRNATIQAATDLFGASSNEVTAVTNAWTSVGVGGSTSSGDAYEPNDSQSQAFGPINSDQVYNGKISSSTDIDWFTFTASNSGTIQLSLGNLPGDYDLYFYNSAGTLLSKSENANTTSESINYTATAAGTFYVRVIGYNGAMSTSQAYALKAIYPASTSGGQWYYETLALDTPHPYANNYNNGSAHTYNKPGAVKVALHFSSFETESGYDYVYIKDKNGTTINNYSGLKDAFWVIIDGDQITSNLVTDYSITKYGYTIDQVGYYSSSPFDGGVNSQFQPTIDGQ